MAPGTPELAGDRRQPTNVAGSESILTSAREKLPYPVARAARAVQLATEATEAYRSVLRCAESTVIVLGVTATAWARHHDVLTNELQALHRAYLGRGVSQGHWLAVLQSLERDLSIHPDAPPGMGQGLRVHRGGAGLLADLNALLRERNLSAHGGEPQNRFEAAERNYVLRPVLERALAAASFLGACDWVVTRSSRYRRREGDFEVTAQRAMSDHPDFEIASFTAKQPLAEDVFYLLTPTSALDLTPLVVLRNCPLCRQAEVAYADRLDARDGVSLKSFDRGHPLFDPSLSDELRTLLEPGGASGVRA